MSKAKWIKIVTDIFDDEKMLLIDGMPKADSIIVIWFKLLCLAGKQNNGGVLMASEKIALTDEMLATILHRPLSTVQLALKTFEEFGMIETVDGLLTIKNWNKHQALDAYERKTENDRLRQARKREEQRALSEKKSRDSRVTVAKKSRDVTLTEEEEEEERQEYIFEEEVQEEKDGSSSSSQEGQDCPFSEIKDLYHKICISFPKIIDIDEKRREAIAAQWEKNRSLDTFGELFRIAESTPFLKGKNERNWCADFDWMMKPENFLRILEHKYDNKPAGEDGPHGETHPGSFDTDEFFAAALNQNTKGETK